VVGTYSNQLATYWFLILTPFVLVAVLVRLRSYRKRKKETDAWLEGDITRHRE
jgi:hypothetical protein